MILVGRLASARARFVFALLSLVFIAAPVLAEPQVVGGRWLVLEPTDESEYDPPLCRLQQIVGITAFGVQLLPKSSDVVLSLSLFHSELYFDAKRISSITVGFDQSRAQSVGASYSDETGSIDATLSDAFLQQFAQAKLMFLAIPGVGAATIDLAGSGAAVAALRSCGGGKHEGALVWMPLRQMTHATRSLIRLTEDESVDDVLVAETRLRETTPLGQTDALFVHRQSGIYCGSAGCLLEVFMLDGSSEKPVLSLNVTMVELGEQYTLGHRNLRFDDAVTWVWNGSAYSLK